MFRVATMPPPVSRLDRPAPGRQPAETHFDSIGVVMAARPAEVGSGTGARSISPPEARVYPMLSAVSQRPG